jgi:hypothetical protein
MSQPAAAAEITGIDCWIARWVMVVCGKERGAPVKADAPP